MSIPLLLKPMRLIMELACGMRNKRGFGFPGWPGGDRANLDKSEAKLSQGFYMFAVLIQSGRHTGEKILGKSRPMTFLDRLGTGE